MPTELGPLAEGIIIGGAGGAAAGLSILGVQGLRSLYLEYRDRRRVFRAVLEYTQASGTPFAPSLQVASQTDLTVNRVSFVGSGHPKLLLHFVGDTEGWMVKGGKDAKAP